MNLYALKKNYLELVEALTENQGELTDELSQALAITKQELQEKSIEFAHIVKTLEYETDVLDAEIKRLQALKTARTKSIERVKQTIKEAMEFFEVTQIKNPTMSLSFRASESTEIMDENLIPKEFWVVKEVKSVDKNAIKAAIKAGQDVQGARISKNNNLQIK